MTDTATQTPSASAVSNSSASSPFDARQPAPVFLALSAAGVILLMFVAFMIGFCLCRRYSDLATRKRFLPAFLRRKGGAPKQPIILRQHDTPGFDKDLMVASPAVEKEIEVFDSHFFVPSLGRHRKTATLSSHAPSLPPKDYRGSPTKPISSVARGLAVSRATGMAITMPPALNYEDIIASPVIASPSAVFSPDVSTLSAHSPREVQRWATFPAPPAARPRTGRLIPETGSARNSPAFGPPSNLRITNDASLAASSIAYGTHSASPSHIGLGLVTETLEPHGLPAGPVTVEQVAFEHLETAEEHEHELQDAATAQVVFRDTPSPTDDGSIDSEETVVGAPQPSLSFETIQQLTWREVPEGSLRTGIPLRLGSCDNLAAITPSSSGMSLVGKPAVPESMLLALEVATVAESTNDAVEEEDEDALDPAGSSMVTPASSRSGATLDTCASSPTPFPLGYYFQPLDWDDSRKAHCVHAQYRDDSAGPGTGGAAGDSGGYQGDSHQPVLTFYPFHDLVSTAATMHQREILDGALLALQEKETQRLIAQQQERTNAAAATQVSPFSQSFYSHPSGSFPASPSPTPNHSSAPPIPSPLQLRIGPSSSSSSSPAVNPAAGSAPPMAVVLRDSASSLKFAAAQLRFSGTGSASAAPSERGSYISPTLKLFHFYSPSASSSSASAHQRFSQSGRASLMGNGLPRPAVRADGVVDVFCGA
ncbi:hypothetical protein OC835_005368 [Tilletia horrida]|nr:hypothetical protein OC835_005368 [Tilletia horrida]